jgi:hypothetical protein
MLKWAWTILWLILLVAYLAVRPTGAHEFWINKYKRLDGSGGGCCGENDCEMIPRESVRATGDGYVLPSGERIGYLETQPSEDGEFWRCEYAGERTCFFAPEPGA